MECEFRGSVPHHSLEMKVHMIVSSSRLGSNRLVIQAAARLEERTWKSGLESGGLICKCLLTQQTCILPFLATTQMQWQT